VKRIGGGEGRGELVEDNSFRSGGECGWFLVKDV